MGKPEAPYKLPDARGHFGPYGGTFVAETLIEALDELKRAYAAAKGDPAFPARSTTPGAGRICSAGRRYTSSARTSTIPARTR
jgi:tryptophan synthase beta subunit